MHTKSLTHEEAIIISSEMKDPAIHETPSNRVVSGRHPVHGPVHVVIPAMGGYVLLAALLPVASRIAAL